ncbi:MAG: hypothetical protein IPF82_02535 [Blastocatellia bacterium]|nr:hypothetical protein [Blastocatellia bacterium]
MTNAHRFKSTVVGLWAMGALVFFIVVLTASTARTANEAAAQSATPGDYVGNEACKTCHEVEFNRFSGTPHAHMAESKYDSDMKRGCENCHGPGQAHVLSESKRKEAMDLGQTVPDYDGSLIVSFKNKGPKTISETCLKCHAGMGEEHGNYRRGDHWRNDVGCVDCHEAHGMPLPKDRTGSQTLIETATEHKIDSDSRVMLKATEPILCITCHSEVRSQFTMPHRHKVLEGDMVCSDCHNPHGGFEQKQMRLSTGVDQACVKCHSDKQGPFTFEHAPLKLEGCAACHTPHGSSNPKMLRRSNVTQLCLECHTETQGIGAPNTPSFHNLASPKYRNCTTCHVMIHGSMSHPLYFR